MHTVHFSNKIWVLYFFIKLCIQTSYQSNGVEYSKDLYKENNQYEIVNIRIIPKIKKNVSRFLF